MSDPYYGQDGAFLWRDKRLGICALDGRKDNVYPVGALGPNTRFCKACIKEHGAVNLRRDANVSLQRALETTGKAQQEIRDMTRRYEEKFGARLDWRIPAKG